MTNLQEYIERQQAQIRAHQQETTRLQQRIKIATNILHNLAILDSLDEDTLRKYSNNQRITGLDPVNRENNDMVYMKLSKTFEYAKEHFWTYAPMIQKKMNDLRLSMERREMKKKGIEGYEYLMVVPIPELVTEWIKDIEARNKK